MTTDTIKDTAIGLSGLIGVTVTPDVINTQNNDYQTVITAIIQILIASATIINFVKSIKSNNKKFIR